MGAKYFTTKVADGATFCVVYESDICRKDEIFYSVTIPDIAFSLEPNEDASKDF